MAGGWSSITTDDGKFRSETFAQLIDNLGDAWEAAEMCFGMVQYLAASLSDLKEFTREEWVEMAEENWKAGLRIGGTEE